MSTGAQVLLVLFSPWLAYATHALLSLAGDAWERQARRG